MDELYYSIHEKPNQRIYWKTLSPQQINAVNQQLIWLQQTSGEYQLWRTVKKIMKFFWGEMDTVKPKQQQTTIISQAKSLWGRYYVV